jgi:hypothetical protein
MSDTSPRWENPPPGRNKNIDDDRFSTFDFDGRSAPRESKPKQGLHIKLQAIRGITKKNLLREAFVFQCPPLEEFGVEYGFTHADYETVSSGQYSRPGGVLLRTLAFDTLFVDYATWALRQDAPPIEDMTEELVELVESGSPFLFTAAHRFPPGGTTAGWGLTLAGPEVQMPATLRSLRVVERAGEGDARYANMTFTEYRDPVVSRAGMKRERGGGRAWPATVVFDSRGRAYDRVNGVENLIGPQNNGLGKPATLDHISRHYGVGKDGQRLVPVQRIMDVNNIPNWGPTTPLLQWKEGKWIGLPRFVAALKRWRRKNPFGLNTGAIVLADASPREIRQSTRDVSPFLDIKLTIPPPNSVDPLRIGDPFTVLR